MHTSAAFLILLATLSAVLLASGAGKLRAGTSAEELRSLGVPSFLRHPTLVALHPWLEIALGLGLLLTSGWLLVAVAAAGAVLMVLYAVLVARAVRTGDAKTCHCFGELFDAQLTWRSVVRNVVLVVMALVVLAGALAGMSAADIVRTDPAILLPVLAAALVAVGVWATVSNPGGNPVDAEPAGPVLSGDHDEYRRLPIPMAWLKIADDNSMTLREIARERARLLIFLSPGCSSCQSLVPDTLAWVEEFPMLGVHPVFFASPDEVGKEMPELVQYAVYDEGAEASRALDMGGFPSAVLLGMDGLLAGGPVVGPVPVRDMVDQLRGELTGEDPAGEVSEIPAGSDHLVDEPARTP